MKSGLVALCEATKRHHQVSARTISAQRMPWLSSSLSDENTQTATPSFLVLLIVVLRRHVQTCRVLVRHDTTSTQQLGNRHGPYVANMIFCVADTVDNMLLCHVEGLKKKYTTPTFPAKTSLPPLKVSPMQLDNTDVKVAPILSPIRPSDVHEGLWFPWLGIPRNSAGIPRNSGFRSCF